MQDVSANCAPYHDVMALRSSSLPLHPEVSAMLASRQKNANSPIPAAGGVTPFDPADHAVLRAQSHLSSALAYKRRNVIAHPHQTFGIEIEVEGVSGDEIAHALFNAGLSTHMDQRPYHEFRESSPDWVVEEDTSVDGAEVISPILHDTPSTWDALAKVCTILKDLGATTSIRTGFHVHVGTASSGIEDDVDAFRRIGKLCSYAEDLLYRISGTNRDGAEVVHRGAYTAYSWCTPVDETALTPEGSVQVESQQLVTHSAKPVLRHSSRFATLEYRYFDGTIDPRRMQQYIALCCALTARAGEIDNSIIPDETHPLGEQYGNSPDPRSTTDDVLATFAAILYPVPSDRRGLYALYQRGSWQPDIDQAQQRLDAKKNRMETAEQSLLESAAGLLSTLTHRPPTPDELTWLGFLIKPSYVHPFPVPSAACNDIQRAFSSRKDALLSALNLTPSERMELSTTIEKAAVSYTAGKVEWEAFTALEAQFPEHAGRMPTAEESRWLRSSMQAALTYSTPPSPEVASLFLSWSRKPLGSGHPQQEAWERNRAYRADIVRRYVEQHTAPSPPPATSIATLS